MQTVLPTITDNQLSDAIAARLPDLSAANLQLLVDSILNGRISDENGVVTFRDENRMVVRAVVHPSCIRTRSTPEEDAIRAQIYSQLNSADSCPELDANPAEEVAARIAAAAAKHAQLSR